MRPLHTVVCGVPPSHAVSASLCCPQEVFGRLELRAAVWQCISEALSVSSSCTHNICKAAVKQAVVPQVAQWKHGITVVGPNPCFHATNGYGDTTSPSEYQLFPVVICMRSWLSVLA